MAFEILILSDGKPTDGLSELATSVQIDQSLDDSTRYTVRFDVDLDECGEYPMLVDPRLRPGAELAFIVRDCKTPTCLVAGPITGAKFHIATGGGGSWIEVTGGDRRVVMDRVDRPKSWLMKDHEIVEQLLGDHDMKPDVEAVKFVKSDPTRSTNQSSTDLQFIRRLVDLNADFHFWISYSLDTDLRGDYEITEVGHFKRSPGGESGKLASAFAAAGAPPRLEINIGDRTAQSMGGIDIEYELEAPTEVQTDTVSDSDLKEESAAVDKPPGDPLGDVTSEEFANEGERIARLAGAGDSAERQARAEAALAAASWCIHASVMCTRYSLLGHIIQPHMVVPVVGLGSRFSGDWFVTAVSHTVDSHSHTMNVTLARNALGA